VRRPFKQEIKKNFRGTPGGVLKQHKLSGVGMPSLKRAGKGWVSSGIPLHIGNDAGGETTQRKKLKETPPKNCFDPAPGTKL